MGRRPAVRRRDRRVRGALRAVSAAGRVRRARAQRRPRRARHASLRGRQRAKLLVRVDGGVEGTLGDPDARRRRRRRHADELMWAERSERRGDAVRRRHVPAAAADRLRRGRLRGGAVQDARRRPAGAPFVVDPRARFAQPARFPDAEEVVAAWPEEAFAAARRHRPRDRDRGAHPRPEARRRRARAGAALERRLHRRDGLAARAGQAARAAAREGDRGRRHGAHLRADRARPRRADRRGDRAVDHGRDRRDAARARRAGGSRTRRAGSTRSACDSRRAGPRRR